jgi:hypothetical protein
MFFFSGTPRLRDRRNGGQGFLIQVRCIFFKLESSINPLAKTLDFSGISHDVSVIYMVLHLAFWQNRSPVCQEIRDIFMFP